MFVCKLYLGLVLESASQLAQRAAHLFQLARIPFSEGPPEIVDMGGKDLGKQCLACRSQDGEETAPVTDRHLPAHQTLSFKAVDDAGQGSLGDQGFLSKFAEGHSLGVAQGSDDVKLRRSETQLPDVGSGVGGKGMIGLGKLPQYSEKRFLCCGLQVHRGLFCRLPKYFFTHLFPKLFAGK